MHVACCDGLITMADAKARVVKKVLDEETRAVYIFEILAVKRLRLNVVGLDQTMV